MINSLLLAISPLLLILVLIFLFRKSLTFSAPITFIFTAFIGLFVWKVYISYMFASVFKGILVAVDIIFIIFGALFFLEFLRETKLIDSIYHYISSVSPDMRVQAILLIWFFGSFIEGTAGFGTPAAIVAPLLVGLGFPAITAVVIALIGNSTAVTFGAVGTPIRVGFANLIELPGVNFKEIAIYVGTINLFAGILVPIMILSVVVLSKKRPQLKQIYEMLPFSIFAGLCFTTPYFLLSFLGYEFPSLVGALIGLLIIIPATKKGFFIPRDSLKIKHKKIIKQEKIFKAMMPYFILIIILIMGKLLLGSVKVNLPGDVIHTINFFNPGFAFVFAVILSSGIYKIKYIVLKNSFNNTLKILIFPFISILFITAFVQIMMLSGNNSVGLPSMIETIASLFKNANINYMPFLSTIIGVFGAFIAGSATVSNVIFGNFQYISAVNSAFNVSLILALQLIGAGIGNMISLTNIVSAQATVRIHGKEKEILKKTIIPCLIYALIVGGIGLIFFKLIG